VISFLTSAKPFAGQTGINQLKALKSWLALSPDVEVILYGYAEGADEVSKNLGIRYVPQMESALSGSPYFNAIADHARQYARHDIQAYVNCDILLTKSVLKAIASITLDKFLILGQRIDLHRDAEIDIERSDVVNQLIELQKHNKVSLHHPGGMDYFIFPRGLWNGISPLIIGRRAFDSGLVAFCLKNKIPIIDASYAVVAIHQFHDYQHLRGGEAELVNGPDAGHNFRHSHTKHSGLEVSDAGWTLRSGKLEKTNRRRDFLRRAELYLRFRVGWTLGGLAVRAVWRILRALRIYPVKNVTFQQAIKGYVDCGEGGA
jgi:hypothetical protein